MDFALAQIGAVPAPIYPSSTAAECCYILEHANVVGCFAEDDELLAKIEGAATARLHHRNAARAALGREHASANPDALERARSRSDDDLFTFIYTSGTTGPPKGCLILNRNYYDMVGGSTRSRTSSSRPTMLLYLPLAHNFGRLMHLLGAHLGYTVAFLRPIRGESGRDARCARPSCRPCRASSRRCTPQSPRTAAATGVKRRLIDWALAVGKEVSELRQRQEPVPAGLALKHRLADRLVYSKVKARLGGRLRAAISGGAPLPKEIGEFFHVLDILILEGWPDRGDDGLERQPPEPPVRHRGSPIPGIEVATAEDGEILIKGPPSSPATTKTSKRRAKSCRETDGCTPATSGRSTRTAS